jgi:hypothetical protein
VTPSKGVSSTKRTKISNYIQFSKRYLKVTLLLVSLDSGAMLLSSTTQPMSGDAEKALGHGRIEPWLLLILNKTI